MCLFLFYSMNSIKYSIIIVTWNGLKHLQRFLPPVFESNHPSYEVIIADNASTDGTSEWLQAHYPQAKHALFNDNYGYAGGNNRAVEYAKGEILIFLNNDAYPDPEWLNGLDRVFSNPKVGAAQPKIRAVNAPESFEYAGAAGGFLDRLGYPFCAGRVFEEVEADQQQYDHIKDIAWASGAALAMRKELFKQLDGFDEYFEFHMEEIDLCWRTWRAGHRIQLAPTSIVYHLGGGSLAMGSPRKVYYNFRNSLYMLIRNLEKGVLPNIFFRLCLDGVAALRSLASGKPAELGAIFKAHMHFYAHLPELLKQRKDLKKHLNGLQAHGMPVYDGLLIHAYFLQKKKTFNALASTISPRD